MNYDVFLALQNEQLLPEAGESDQSFMERVLAAAYAPGDEATADRIYNRMEPAFHSCSAQEKQLCIAYRAEAWTLNPQDTLHGGALSTAIDMAMSVLARYLKKLRSIVTVQLSINFLRPIQAGDTYLVKAWADHVGRRSVMIRCEVCSASTGKMAATASGVFL